MPPSIRAPGSPELVTAAGVRVPLLPARTTLAVVAGHLAGRAGLALTAFTLAFALVAPLLAVADPFALSGPPLAAPSWGHPMGTDALGRDLWSGVLFGARTSLLVATGVVVLAFVCGAGIGLVSGYAGGRVDNVLMRATELFQVLPRFLLVVVAIALFGGGLEQLVITLGVTSWPTLARVVRAEVLSLRESDFVRAAEAMGATPARILWRQLLPNVMPSAIVMLGLLFGQVLLVEASLGFLGIGDPNALSWGTLAGQAQSYLRVAWWLSLFPGLAITLAVLGVNLLADSLAAALAGRR